MPRTKKRLPVIVSRWFKEGHNYAFSPGVDDKLLTDVGTCLSKYRDGPQTTNIDTVCKDKRVFGIQQPDPVPLDAKAMGRPAHIMCVVVDELRDSARGRNCQAVPKEDAQILGQLRGLSLPEKSGPDTGLEIFVYGPPALSAIPVQSPGPMGLLRQLFTQVSLWALGICIATAVAGVWWLQGVQPSTAQLLSALLLLASLIAIASWLRRPWPKPNDIRTLEMHWYGGALPEELYDPEALAGACLILPNGRGVHVAIACAMEELPLCRDPDDSVAYDKHVHVQPGLLVLCGQERLLSDGAFVPASFVRAYVWQRYWWLLGGRWRLGCAQWTWIGSRVGAEGANASP